MNAGTNPMGEFFERLGHKVIRSESGWWHEVQPRVLLSFPYYRLIEPTEEEIKELLEKYSVRVIRYPTPLNGLGFASTVELNTNSAYDLDCLSRRARLQTRNGLKNCTIEQIDFDYLSKQGLALNRDTSERQAHESPFSDPDYWRRYCLAGRQTEGCVAWGAFIDGVLATYMVGVEFDGWLNGLMTASLTAFLKKRPSNALLYHVSQYYLRQRGANICYGLGSLEDVSGLDHFKRSMGWELKPIKQRLVLSKMMRYGILPFREPLLRMMNKIFPRSYKVRKVSAIIRLYRQQSYNIPVCDGNKKTTNQSVQS